jgi:ATP-dependent helicase/nuclease subunit A
LRDPLTTSREEEEDARRLDEGRAVARPSCRRELKLPQARWSDVMLLVKKAHASARLRTRIARSRHSVCIRQARRFAGITGSGRPDRLLTFLITPHDNLALAHVLKSPIDRRHR